MHADLDALAAFGFAIERHPYRGAAYIGPAERLCPDQIEHELGTDRVGRRIAVWSRVSSTNDLAAGACGSASNDGLVVLAEEQTAGRGRLGRSWTAPPRSSILMSVLLFPPRSSTPRGRCRPDVAWLTAMGAVATAEVVSAWIGREAAIKWPNDVRVDGRKIAGILVERPASQGLPASTAAATDGDGPGPPDEPGPAAVIGIGLNVNLESRGPPRRSAGPGDLDPDRERRQPRGSLRGRTRPDPTARPLVRGRPVGRAAPHSTSPGATAANTSAGSSGSPRRADPDPAGSSTSTCTSASPSTSSGRPRADRPVPAPIAMPLGRSSVSRRPKSRRSRRFPPRRRLTRHVGISRSRSPRVVKDFRLMIPCNLYGHFWPFMESFASIKWLKLPIRIRVAGCRT